MKKTFAMSCTAIFITLSTISFASNSSLCYEVANYSKTVAKSLKQGTSSNRLHSIINKNASMFTEEEKTSMHNIITYISGLSLNEVNVDVIHEAFFELCLEGDI